MRKCDNHYSCFTVEVQVMYAAIVILSSVYDSYSVQDTIRRASQQG